jgi:hypothetical protein
MAGVYLDYRVFVDRKCGNPYIEQLGPLEDGQNVLALLGLGEVSNSVHHFDLVLSWLVIGLGELQLKSAHIIALCIAAILVDDEMVRNAAFLKRTLETTFDGS